MAESSHGAHVETKEEEVHGPADAKHTGHPQMLPGMQSGEENNTPQREPTRKLMSTSKLLRSKVTSIVQVSHMPGKEEECEEHCIETPYGRLFEWITGWGTNNVLGLQPVSGTSVVLVLQHLFCSTSIQSVVPVQIGQRHYPT